VGDVSEREERRAVDVLSVSSAAASALSMSVRWSVISENVNWRDMDKRAEAVVNSAVLSVLFVRMASTGSH